MVMVEVLTYNQRMRRWSAQQKKAMVLETEQPGMSISLVTRSTPTNSSGGVGSCTKRS
jgi:transposase-like protein